MSASLRRQAEDNCTESDGDGCGEAILVTTPPPIFSNFYLKLLANKFLNVAHTNFWEFAKNLLRKYIRRNSLWFTNNNFKI